MTNPNEPINPTIWDDKHNPTFVRDNDGLTKREYFAGLALQGYCSAGSTGMPTAENLANYAVTVADELIKQLNKTQS